MILLATTSPRRIELLKKSGIKFKAVSSGYREHKYRHLTASQLVVTMALGKAKAAGKKFPRATIVAADTVVWFENQVLGKPKNEKHAATMLKALSGKVNYIYSGFAVLNGKTKEIKTGHQQVKVKFKKYSEQVILDYIKTGEPLDKAGAYAIQGWGKRLVKKVEGDMPSAIGLPIAEIKKVLKLFGEI